MSLLRSADLTVKMKRRNPKNMVYLNEEVSFKINQKEGTHFMILGKTRLGKTYSALMCCNQFPAAIFFDPQKRVRENLELQGEVENWHYYKMGESAPETWQTFLKIKVSDLHPRFIDTCFYSMQEKVRKVNLALKEFFNKPESFKTYENLKLWLCERYKYNIVWDWLKPILAANEAEAVNLNDFHKQRNVVDMAEVGQQSILPAILVETIIGYRQDRKFKENHPMIIGIDECQKFAAQNTFTGKALSNVFERAGVFGISGMVVGTHQADLQSGIKNNVKVLVLFRVTFDLKTISLYYGFDAFYDSMEKLPLEEKGWALYFNEPEGIISPKIVHFDLYYQSFRKKTVDAPVVRIAPENWRRLTRRDNSVRLLQVKQV